MGLPVADDVRSLNQDIADVLLTDASDAPQRLGAEQSDLYDRLKWAGQIEVAVTPRYQRAFTATGRPAT